MSVKHCLKDILEYNPITGIFTWKVATRAGIAGKTAGSIDANGYCIIRYKNKAYKAHRLAFLYMTGTWPLSMLDHIDLNKANNSWNNLRLCTAQQNCMNRVRKHSTTGIKNVFFEDNRYRVRLKVGGKMRSFGSYKDPELAELVAMEARVKYHEAFARHTL